MRPLPQFDFDPHPGKTDTSAEAAEKIKPDAPTLREKVYALVALKPLTSDEIATMMGEDILSIRPRLSELREKGLIGDSGLRRPNIKGNRQIVYCLRPVTGFGSIA